VTGIAAREPRQWKLRPWNTLHPAVRKRSAASNSMSSINALRRRCALTSPGVGQRSRSRRLFAGSLHADAGRAAADRAIAQILPVPHCHQSHNRLPSRAVAAAALVGTHAAPSGSHRPASRLVHGLGTSIPFDPRARARPVMAGLRGRRRSLRDRRGPCVKEKSVKVLLHRARVKMEKILREHGFEGMR
jgi:hypothetical protein